MDNLMFYECSSNVRVSGFLGDMLVFLYGKKRLMKNNTVRFQFGKKMRIIIHIFIRTNRHTYKHTGKQTAPFLLPYQAVC